MGNIAERLLVIVNDQVGGRHTVFAKKAGIPTSTFQGYVNGRYPHAEHLIRIREIFSVNINWLLTGEGDPYIKEGEKDREQVVEPREPVAGPESAGGVARAIEMLMKILGSGNETLVRAIISNLEAFSETVELKERLLALEEKSQERNEKLSSRLAQLEKEITTLRKNAKKEENHDHPKTGSRRVANTNKKAI